MTAPIMDEPTRSVYSLTVTLVAKIQIEAESDLSADTITRMAIDTLEDADILNDAETLGYVSTVEDIDIDSEEVC